jgi:hypothetical protein
VESFPVELLKWRMFHDFSEFFRVVSQSFKSILTELNSRGVGGLSAWSWIFILEGLLSILVSFTAYWAIYDYPATYECSTNLTKRVT